MKKEIKKSKRIMYYCANVGTDTVFCIYAPPRSLLFKVDCPSSNQTILQEVIPFDIRHKFFRQ